MLNEFELSAASAFCDRRSIRNCWRPALESDIHLEPRQAIGVLQDVLKLRPPGRRNAVGIAVAYLPTGFEGRGRHAALAN